MENEKIIQIVLRPEVRERVRGTHGSATVKHEPVLYALTSEGRIFARGTVREEDRAWIEVPLPASLVTGVPA